MSKKVIAYIAVSNDGFVADKNGSVAWLEQAGENNQQTATDYEQFINRCDSIVFGKKVYNQIIGWKITWPYSNLKSYLFTNQLVKDDNVSVVSGDVSLFMNQFKNQDHQKALWLMGGANLISQFFQANLIDEYVITVLKTTNLNEGIKLNEYEFLKTKTPDVVNELSDNFIQYVWYLK